MAPVSPSTPLSWLLLVNQTIASDVPSVVVAIGLVGPPVIAAHQATVAASGFGAMRSATTWRPVPPPGQPLAMFIVMTTYVPIAVR